MIGVFDSGMGGRITLGYLQDILPQQSFLYLGDTKFLPYGEKNPAFIQERTFACIQWMFAQGCDIVILACNSASAYAIRPRQEQYPDRKVLSVTVPGVEAIVAGGYQRPLLLATTATIRSDIYGKVMKRITPEHSDIDVTGHTPVGRVQAVESGHHQKEVVESFFKTCDLSAHDCIVLGCTHYPDLIPYIQAYIGKDIALIDPGYVAAQQLVTYISRHPEIFNTKNKNTAPKVQYRVTGSGEGGRAVIISGVYTAENIYYKFSL